MRLNETAWSDTLTEYPFCIKLYLFNCTNWGEVETKSKGVKPDLQQVGPYIWRVYVNDTGISFVYQKDLSMGDLKDVIATLNPLPVVS